jgi:3D (Asp-Asp-Asp) domain-containing protein/peptidoglycan hydrolase CwlO-like protein
VQARLRRAATLLTVAASIAAAAVTASAGTAERQQQTAALRAENQALAQRARTAVLELYALDSRIARTRSELAAIRARTADVAHERAQLARRLEVALQTLDRSQGLLARRLLALYQQEEADALAILLGSDSLDEAIAGLEGLEAVASHDARIVAETRRAKRELAARSRELAARTATLARLAEVSAAKVRALEAERTDRDAYISGLVAERRLNTARIAALERTVATARVRTERLEAPAAPPLVLPSAPEPSGPGTRPPRPAGGARTLTVLATAYTIVGRTATGIPTAPGVVAVDPAVIPLGSRMSIPGYGEGIAADVGSSVRGAKIDLWFPTRAQALAWGERTVTITLR